MSRKTQHMDYPRRFLRYIVPGLIFGIEIAVYISIVLDDWTLYKVRELFAKDGLGTALVALLASGALGYIFAALHHWWHWYCDRGILDHAPLINRLIAQKLIPDPHPGRTLNRGEAWDLSIALWYERAKPDGQITETADKKVSSLGDQAHGLGATRAASVVALLTTLLFCSASPGTILTLKPWPITCFVFMVLLALVS